VIALATAGRLEGSTSGQALGYLIAGEVFEKGWN
jgi:hypothetical protein